MDISVIEEFTVLVDTCSFQETAAIMNISQSALTKHIHKLEDELNVPLFDRSSRTITPTEFSNDLYPYAKQIVKLYHDSLSMLSEKTKKDLKSFTVAYSPIIGQYGLINTISQFTQKFPEDKLYTIESYSPVSVLKQKKCNFAFVAENETEDSNYNKLIYKTDHLAVVFPANHPLAGLHSVSLTELEGEDFILHSTVNNVRTQETEKFMDLCDSMNFSPNIVTESQYTSTIVRFVSAGRGIAVLNRMHIPTDVHGISVVDLVPPVLSYIYMLYPGHLSNPSAIDFLHFMVERINTDSDAFDSAPDQSGDQAV